MMTSSAYRMLTAINFWDRNVWSFLLLCAVLFISMVVAHILKNNIKFLNKSLIPASVLGGIIILIFTSVFKLITKESFFDQAMFSITNETGNALSGSTILETITYHCLGLGFVCMAFRSTKKEKEGKRTAEILNTGITTVSTYLLQAIIGLVITIVAFVFIYNRKNLNPAAGILLALGYGQGTGQALNFGTTYAANTNIPFLNGDHFGLAIAALGFLSASIGGVICLNILKAKNQFKKVNEKEEELQVSHFQGSNEISLNSSIDKLTIQVAIVIGTYMLSYFLMNFLGGFFGDNMKGTIFGFNFLLGTLMAILVKVVLNFLKKKNVIKKDYINDFMMNRLSGVVFDVMIVAGIAAIDLDMLKEYWLLLIIMGVVGAVCTYAYLRFVCKKLFPKYHNEQFFAMYGMLTGTASTGIILLREIDPNFESPASNNLVYQNFPAIILGFPIMTIAAYAPNGLKECLIAFGIIFAYFVVLVIVLFRSKIFKKKKAKESKTEEQTM